MGNLHGYEFSTPSEIPVRELAMKILDEHDAVEYYPNVSVRAERELLLRDGVERLRVIMTNRLLTGETDYVRYPADWWEAVKDRWFPRWAKRRWPVRWAKVAQKRYCPHIDVRNSPTVHYAWLFQGMEGWK
jgi:hypothetical protein